MSQGKPSLKQRILGWLGFGSSSQSTNKTTNRPSSKSSQGERKKQPVTSTKLFVGNLSYSVNEKQLQELFQSAGEVKKAEIVKHGKSNRSKGFGFVTMETKADAENAARKLDGKKIENRPISVSGAKADSRKPSTNKKKTTSKKASQKKTAFAQNDQQRKGPSNRGPKSQLGKDSKGKGRSKGGQGSKKSMESTVVPMPVPEVMTANLIISNVDETFSETDLKSLFEGVAVINESKFQDGKVSLQMQSIDAAQEAVRLLDGKDFMGKTLSITEA